MQKKKFIASTSVLKRYFKKEFKKIKLKNILFLIIAGLINSLGVTLFILPSNLYDSGISGVSLLIINIINNHYFLSLLLILLNFPLFIIGYKKQGFAFTFYSLIAVFFFSLFSFLITNVFKIAPIAKNELLLCAVFGGILSGFGSGITIREGGAIDGVDVLAVIFAKKLNLSVGSFVMIFNLFIYILAGIIFKSWILPLYSIITYALGLKTVDFIIEGIDRSKAATIVTTNYEEVCKALSYEFECGITIYDAKGYYLGEDKKIVYIIVNRFQIAKMRQIVHLQDPNAYISIHEVVDVFKGNKDTR